MTFDQFKQILICNTQLGFSPENSIDLNLLTISPQKRRLSYRKISNRKLSVPGYLPSC